MPNTTRVRIRSRTTPAIPRVSSSVTRVRISCSQSTIWTRFSTPEKKFSRTSETYSNKNLLNHTKMWCANVKEKMESSPGSIETQIDCFLEQFKRSASKVMEERANTGTNTTIDTVTRSRSLCLSIDSSSGICYMYKPCLSTHLSTRHTHPVNTLLQPNLPIYFIH